MAGMLKKKIKTKTRPSEEQSQAAREKIERAFARRVNVKDKYTVAYAYYVDEALLSRSVYSYLLGFSPKHRQIVIMPLDKEGQPGKSLRLKTSEIDKAFYDKKGNLVIKSKRLAKILKIVVAPFTPIEYEEMHLLPVIQEETAAQFQQFIKNCFDIEPPEEE
jgi:hypothetical protein